MLAQQLWHIPGSKTEIREQELDSFDEKLRVRARYSFISQGTEQLVRKGLVPRSMWEQMQVPNMLGSFQLPICYGYSLVGEILEGPAQWLGKVIHTMHPHASHFQVEADQSLSEIPASYNMSVIANLETAISATWDAEIKIGERILIVGMGSIGFLIALLARQVPGTQVFFVEKNPERSALAEDLGLSPLDASLSYDVAFHSTGTEEGLQQAVDALGFEGRVVEVSWYGDRSISLQLGASFHSERKRIISSQVSRIPASLTGRWDLHRRKKLAIDLLRSLELPGMQLISLAQACDWFNGAWHSNSPFLIIDYSL